MNPMIVTYSLTGNTAACAFALAKALDTSVFLLEEAKPRRGKKRVLVTGGFAATVGVCSRLKALPDLSQADTLLIGMPVWGGTTPPAINTVLRDCNLSGKRVYAFATQAGDGTPKKLENALKQRVMKQGGEFVELFLLQAPYGKQLSVEKAMEPARKWANRITAEK